MKYLQIFMTQDYEKNIDGKFRDLMIENGHITHDNFQYPKDGNKRYFYSSCYQRSLENGEKHDRRWLVYSKYLDKVYYFCCKLELKVKC